MNLPRLQVLLTELLTIQYIKMWHYFIRNYFAKILKWNYKTAKKNLHHSWFFAANDFSKLRRTADIALLMTNAGDACGIAYLNVISIGQTLGVALKLKRLL